MQWSPQQDAALLAVKRWLESGSNQVFKLFGYAGCGKTVLSKQIADDYGKSVAFAAFTGKAASVLRSKGCRGATTIHKLIYAPVGRCLERLAKLVAARKLEAAKAKPDPAVLSTLDRRIDEEEVEARKVSFVGRESNEELPGLLIVDECSMLSADMGQDLLATNRKVLVLGDPAQLPPIRGQGFFNEGSPDVMLTEVHRQAKDNPVLRMATIVREGGELVVDRYGDSDVVVGSPPAEEVVKFDQIICGTNARRRAINARCREVLGRKSPMPEVGDKVVCLRNDHKLGIMNGEVWWVAECDDGDPIAMTVADDVDPLNADRAVQCEVHPEHFVGREPSALVRLKAQEFDYGTCLTGHKSQGSEWRSVLVFDESHVFRQDARRWLYTALTRASHRVTVVRAR